jgi:hypothetical protein
MYKKRKRDRGDICVHPQERGVDIRYHIQPRKSITLWLTILILLRLLRFRGPASKPTRQRLTVALLSTKLTSLFPLVLVLLPRELCGSCHASTFLGHGFGEEGVGGQRTDSIFAAVDAEGGAKGPVNGFFDRVIEEVGKERYDGETKLETEKKRLA